MVNCSKAPDPDSGTAEIGKDHNINLVTHAPKQVEDLCDLAVWLDQGEARLQGPAQEVAQAYKEFISGT